MLLLWFFTLLTYRTVTCHFVYDVNATRENSALGWIVSDLMWFIIRNQLPKCAVVLALGETHPGFFPANEFLLQLNSEYRFGLMLQEDDTEFPYRFEDYLGLVRQEDLYSFRTIPPELLSRQPLNNECTLNLIAVKDFQQFRSLTVRLASLIRVRNLEDYFVIWTGKDLERTLLSHPASGIKYKIGVSKTNRCESDELRLTTVCFNCDGGNPTFHNLWCYDKFYQPGPAYELFPDMSRQLRGRKFKSAFMYDLSIEEINAKVDRNGIASLPILERLLWEIVDIFNTTIELYLPPIDDIKTYETRLENGSWVGTVGEILKGASDISAVGILTSETIKYMSPGYPAMHINYMFTVRKARPLLTWDVIVRPFSYLAWICVISCVLVGSLSLTMISKSEGQLFRAQKAMSLKKSLGYTLQSLVEQSFHVPSLIATRTFTAFMLFFAIIFVSAYKSKLVSMMSSPPLQSIPLTYEQLLDSSYRFGMDTGQYIFLLGLLAIRDIPTLYQLTKSPRFVIADPFDKCIRYSYESKYACISLDLLLKEHIPSHVSLEGEQLLLMAGKSDESWFYLGPSFPRDSVYAGWVGRAMQIYVGESDLLEKVYNDHVHYELLKNVYNQKHEVRKPLNLSYFISPFGFLVCGLSVSVVFFVCEHVQKRCVIDIEKKRRDEFLAALNAASVGEWYMNKDTFCL